MLREEWYEEFRWYLQAEERLLLADLIRRRRRVPAPTTEHHTPFRLRVVVTYPC